MDTDKMLTNLANRKIREEIGELIVHAKREDEKALQGLKQLTFPDTAKGMVN